MKTYGAIAMLAIGLSATAGASAQNCKLTGNTYDTGHGVYACDDGYGNVTLGDRNGNPIRQRETPAAPVNSNPFGSALGGQRAAQDDVNALRQFQQEQQMQQQQEQQQQQQQQNDTNIDRVRSEKQKQQQLFAKQWRERLTTTPKIMAQRRINAENGVASDETYVGLCYLFGVNVPKNEALAIEWFKKGALQNNYTSEFELARTYCKGSGIGRDLILCYAWYNVIGAVSNDTIDVNALIDEASRRRDAVGSLLSSADLAEAQRLSTNWKPGADIKREAGIR